MMNWVPLATLCGSCLLASVAAGGGAYEWAGIFKVPDAKYMWTAQKVKGKYADATMKIAALPATSATKAVLSASEQKGKDALKTTCTPLEPSKAIVPADNKCYQLKFDAALWQSVFTVDTSSVANVAFFTEHVPTEFESDAHYLKDKAGEDIEPEAELPEPKPKAHKDEPKADWGNSMGASILVAIVTMVGLLLAVPAIARMAKTYAAPVEGVLSAFAAGALLACAFFLLLFEATHLINEGWKKEVNVLWRWGTMVLAGFILPAVIESPVALLMEAKSKPAQGAEAEGEPKEASPATRARVISAVCLGDFMHNLCDGFFVGAAFKGCGSSFGWSVASATILHEIPQELADYVILTGSSCGMKPWLALLVNFLSGLSVILGTIIVNVLDLDNEDIGLLLAFGGGTYVYLAAVECMPRTHSQELSAKVRVLCLLAFIVGAVLIGLILLDHKHCVPDTGAGGGGGGHGH